MPARNSKTVADRAGFTLVEMLVVMGIIAILMSIMLPAVSKAQEQSRRAVCLANLRSLGQAMIMYADQNHDRLPNLNPPNTGNDYDATNAVLILLNQDYVRSAAAFHCPSDSDPVQKSIDTADYVSENSARTSYEFFSVWWMPEKGPRLSRLKDAPLAWDLNVDPKLIRADGQNHGVRGGNVVYSDGSAAWQEAPQWDQSNWPHPAVKCYQ